MMIMSLLLSSPSILFQTKLISCLYSFYIFHLFFAIPFLFMQHNATKKFIYCTIPYHTSEKRWDLFVRQTKQGSNDVLYLSWNWLIEVILFSNWTINTSCECLCRKIYIQMRTLFSSFCFSVVPFWALILRRLSCFLQSCWELTSIEKIPFGLSDYFRPTKENLWIEEQTFFYYSLKGLIIIIISKWHTEKLATKHYLLYM